jgi:phenylalanyl-tRNA synthetase beta chain
MLNGETAVLDAKTLVVKNAADVSCIAGYMGLDDGSCSDSESSIYLEAACFSAEQVAYHCRRYKWHTQSGSRFERGIDFSYTKTALLRAIALLQEYAGFQPDYRLETIVRAQKNRLIELSDHQVSSILGANISAQQVERALVRSACEVEISGEKMHVHVPSWRNDLQIPESLVAEYLRLGLTEQIEGKPLHPSLPHNVNEFNQEDILVQRLREMMLGYGFTETFTYSFAAQEDVLPFAESEACIVQLENPIAQSLAVLRTALFPGLLRQVCTNLAKRSTAVQLFELGQCFAYGDDRMLNEQKMLAVAMSGAARAESWMGKEQFSFFHAKSLLVETLTSHLGRKIFSQCVWRPGAIAGLHPHQSGCFYLGDIKIGACGLLHPQLARQYKVQQEVFFAELNVQAILRNVSVDMPYLPVSNKPAMRRDLSLTVPDKIGFYQIKSEIQRSIFKFLKKVVIFDIYRGRQISEGHYSVSIGLLFQDDCVTLQDEQLQPMLDDLTQRLSVSLGIKTRGGKA